MEVARLRLGVILLTCVVGCAGCSDGYSGFSGRCYKLITTPMTHVDGHQHCQSKTGGSLVIIDTENLRLFLEGLVAGATEDIYIGLGNLITNGAAVKWVNNEGVGSYPTNWASGESSGNGNTARCATMDATDSWKWVIQLNTCSSQTRPFLCEADSFGAPEVATTTTEAVTTTTEVATTTTEAVTTTTEAVTDQMNNCRYNFSYAFGSNCYDLFLPEVTWQEAETECQCYQGHLVSMSSQEESDFIANLYTTLSVYPTIWAGLRRDTSGSVLWPDGATLTFQNFKSGEYFDGNNQCITLDVPSGEWTVQNCVGNSFPYICEISRNISTPDSCVDFRLSDATLTEPNQNPLCETSVSTAVPSKLADVIVNRECLTPCTLSDVTFNVTIPDAYSCSDVNLLHEPSGGERCHESTTRLLKCQHQSEAADNGAKYCMITCQCPSTDNCHIHVFDLIRAVPICDITLQH